MAGFGGDLAYTAAAIGDDSAELENSSTTAPEYVFEQPSSTAKTPISYLQEICTRRAMKPEYELLSTEGQVSLPPVHEPTFMYRVAVSDLSAVGHGKSKRAAKHMASKALLERIVETGRYKDFGIGETSSDAAETLSKLTDAIAPSAASGTKTSGEDQSATNNNGVGGGASADQSISSTAAAGEEAGGESGPGNPIGRLQEMCMQQKWSTPAYEVVKEEGAPHDRLYVVKITLAGRSVEGSSRSKKGAKREAADKMLRSLEKSPLATKGENIGISEEDELAETGGGQTIVQQPIGELDEHFSNLSQQQQESLIILRSVAQDEIFGMKKLAEIDLNKEAPGEKHVSLLKLIGEEENWEPQYYPLPRCSTNGEYQCLVQLDVKPVAVCYGKGATEDNARQAAAHNALEYLKLATKK